MDFRGDWVWVSLNYVTVALLIRNGEVVLAPPVARWTVGRDEGEVAAWFRKRGAKFVRLI
jgi:hypothetical protein